MFHGCTQQQMLLSKFIQTCSRCYAFRPQVPSPRVLCFFTGVRISADSEQPFLHQNPTSISVIPMLTRQLPFYRIAHLISTDGSTGRISEVGDTAEHLLCSTRPTRQASWPIMCFHHLYIWYSPYSDRVSAPVMPPLFALEQRDQILFGKRIFQMHMYTYRPV